MRKSDKVIAVLLYKGATKEQRKLISTKPKERMTMEYEVKKPAGYTGI